MAPRAHRLIKALVGSLREEVEMNCPSTLGLTMTCFCDGTAVLWWRSSYIPVVERGGECMSDISSCSIVKVSVANQVRHFMFCANCLVILRSNSDIFCDATSTVVCRVLG